MAKSSFQRRTRSGLGIARRRASRQQLLRENEERERAEGYHADDHDDLHPGRSVRPRERPHARAALLGRRGAKRDARRARHVEPDEGGEQQPHALEEHAGHHAHAGHGHQAHPHAVLREHEDAERDEDAHDDLEPEERGSCARRHDGERLGAGGARVRHSQRLAAHEEPVDGDAHGQQAGQVRQQLLVGGETAGLVETHEREQQQGQAGVHG